MSDSPLATTADAPALHDAQTNGATPASATPPRSPGHVPGEVGVWVFILGDMTVFALLFGVFMYYRNKQPALFGHSELDLHRYFGAINTLVLLTSSLCVVTAVRAIRKGARRLATFLIAIAMVCGAIFLMNKGLEWSSLIADGHKPATNNFFMYFFVLTGIHAFHLLIGMGVLVVLFVLSRKEQLTGWQVAFVEGGGCFWHMVDLLWVVLFALLYLAH